MVSLPIRIVMCSVVNLKRGAHKFALPFTYVNGGVLRKWGNRNSIGVVNIYRQPLPEKRSISTFRFYYGTVYPCLRLRVKSLTVKHQCQKNYNLLYYMQIESQ